jgi:hypothetical protein
LPAELVGRTSASAGGRALVPTAPAPFGSDAAAPHRSDRFDGSRPCGGFLAQLIATAQQAPQTRARRRAAPGDASAAYAAAVSRCIDPGRLVRRSA